MWQSFIDKYILVCTLIGDTELPYMSNTAVFVIVAHHIHASYLVGPSKIQSSDLLIRINPFMF